VLTQDSLGPNGNGGWFTMNDGTVLNIEWIDIGPDNTVVMDLRGRTAWRQAWLEGTFSAGCDSPGRDPYHAHWPGLLEAPLSLDGPPPCMTLSGRAVTSQSRRFADSRAAFRVDERATFSVGLEHIE